MDTNITESFIAMVEAYKVKPELEAQVRRLGEDNALCYQTIDLKNQTITTLDSTIAELRAKLSEVTTQRDDAMFRNLELEEKLGGIERLLGLAERVESARKAEHEATVAALTPKPVEQEYNTKTGEIEPVVYTGPIDPVVVEPQGQSDENPTVSPTEIVTDTTTSKDGLATQTQSEPKINPYSGFPIHYPDGEYKGQSYYDKPSWVSWAAWCDAGGEAEPYMQQVTR